MLARKIDVSIFGLLCVSLFQSLTLGVAIQASDAEKEEYRQDLAIIEAKRASLNPKLDKAAFQKDPDGYMKQLMASRDKNDLDAYEKFADVILNKWSPQSPEHYGCLTLELCKPLSSGNFNNVRDVGLARKYALSALEKPDEIPLELELELTGHVMTHPGMRYSPKGQEFAQNRQKDCQVRLHAWKRLLDAIDPTWDPNEGLSYPTEIPRGVQAWAGGTDPKAIKDPVVRAEYEAILEEYRKKTEKYNEQYRLRKWFKRYPKKAEEYIIRAYSTAPYNNEELVQYLNDYKIGEEINARIIDAVTKNIEKQNKKP
ncbi:MAG: hypothetical protein ABFR90_00910 [Planctomycetota bacterium]